MKSNQDVVNFNYITVHC